jgi:hypothetical protein
VTRCESITKRADAVIKAKAFLADKGKPTVWAWVWLLVGNLLPAILLVAANVVYFISLTDTAMYVLLGICFVMILAGLYFLFRLLGRISLFSGGVFHLVLRFVAICFVVYFILGLIQGTPLAYLGLSAAINLIFALTLGREYLIDKRLVKTVERLMPEGAYDEMAQQMRSDCEAEMEKAISGYRQYYRTDEEWNKDMNDWLDRVKQNVLKFLNTAKAQADTAAGL